MFDLHRFLVALLAEGDELLLVFTDLEDGLLEGLLLWGEGEVELCGDEGCYGVAQVSERCLASEHFLDVW